jgi:hypothetical protein
VVNISSAVEEVFRPRPVDAARRDALFARYGIQRGFLMYTKLRFPEEPGEPGAGPRPPYQ